MSETSAYRPTRPDIEWIAGRRVQPGEPLMLTDAEAAHDLARGNIELVPAEPVAAAEPEAAAEQDRRRSRRD